VSKRTVLLLLGAFILLSIAVRYPLVEHERFQTDSYTIHYFAKAITDDGYAVWTFNTLSYFGYYPFSYPSGVPFFMAELSSMTGMSVELSILVADWGFAAIFCLGVFVLARQFISRPECALLATLFTLLGARFVDTTYWDGSARGPLVVLITLAVFALFRSVSRRQNKLFIVAALLGVGCFATHHMAVFLVIFGLGYVLAAFQSQFVLRKAGTHKRTVAAIWTIATAASIAIITFPFFDYFGDMAVMNLQRSSLFDIKPVYLSVVLNMAVSYTNQIGFILLFAVAAIPGIFRESKFSVKSLFPLTLAVAFIPLYGNTLYVSMILAPFIAVLGTIWISRWYRSARKKTNVVVVISLLLAVSVFVPIWSSARWNQRAYLSGDTVEVDGRFFSDAAYLRVNYPEDYAICNSNTMCIQLAATSGTHFLSSGIASAINGDITNEDVARNVTWSSDPFPTNLYTWFGYGQDGREPPVDYYVREVMMYGVSVVTGGTIGRAAQDYFHTHSRLLVAIDNTHPNEFSWMYSVEGSKLTDQLKQASWSSNKLPVRDYDLPSYIVYESGRITLYAVQLPA
jgi:hypothetical protein